MDLRLKKFGVILSFLVLFVYSSYGQLKPRLKRFEKQSIKEGSYSIEREIEIKVIILIPGDYNDK